jgi:hypothetical protein
MNIKLLVNSGDVWIFYSKIKFEDIYDSSKYEHFCEDSIW